MISRYPHTATVTIETLSDDPIPVASTETLEIKGRYEPITGAGGGNMNLNYKAMYFCKDRIELLKSDPYALDGKEINVFGRKYGIAKAWNYQTHCEIWLD